MKVWLLDTEKFIKVNGLQEVTNPFMFDAGNIPTKDGLFSTEIFGTSTNERRDTFAYINLYKKFINPKVYITLLRLNRKFEYVVYGTKRFIIDNAGVLVEDEKGDTGIEWLYKVWDKIKFEKNDSNQRAERIDLLETNKKDVIFSDKLVILPAFLRDVNIQSNDSTRPKVPEINSIYAKIIRNVSTLKDATTLDFVLRSIEGKIQEAIVEVYNLIKEKIQGKNGYIRRFLMGKSIDYGSRVVITAAPYDAPSVKSQPIDFYHTGVPLSHVCSEFTPFMIFWLKSWFKNNLENQSASFIIIDDKGEKQLVKLDNPESYYNEEYIEKHLAQYVKTPSSRFDKILIPVAKKDMERLGLKEYPTYKFEGVHLSGDDINTIEKVGSQKSIRRELTWTDLLYMAAVDVTSDKHVWVTRYPILDYHGMYTTKIAVLSTRETMPMMISGMVYPNYPVIKTDVDNKNIDMLFRDTINICPIYLAAMGADHDGDQTTSKGTFTQEANQECDKIMMSKSNILSIEGTNIRGTGNEGIQTLYSLTKFVE